jgi:N-acetylmuramoyl-L-alanine amidase
MKIRRHRLQDESDNSVPFTESPNIGSGRLDPQYLVMHYTAGHSFESSVEWFTNPQAKASAHLVIGRDGSIVQMVPFDRVAWHAGQSRWRGMVGLNHFSVGIELDNAGILTRQGGKWKAWFGDDYPEDDLVEAVHQHETIVRGWHAFTSKQLEIATEVAATLVTHYQLRDIVGHDDIAPGRKVDPGPAFPMESFRSRALGRSVSDPEPFETVVELNIRTGPGIEFEKLPRSPLQNGTRLFVNARAASWCAVDVLDVDGNSDLIGWVHGDFIRPVA